MYRERCMSGSARGHAKLPVATSARRACSTQPFLPAAVIGRWFYLYLILDVYSHKIVGFEVHDSDDAEHAAHLVKRTALAEGHPRHDDQAGAASRQRLHAQGHDGAGDAVLAGCQAVVLAPARE